MDRLIHGANWYIDTLNQRKRLETVQLPNLTRVKESYSMGGGLFSLDVPYEIEALEAPFSLNGVHEDVRSLFGREPGDWTNFYYYERLRDIEQGKNLGRVVVLRGLVSEVTQAEVKGLRGDSAKYKVSSIVLYRDIVDGKRVHEFDLFNNKLVINNIDYSADHNQLIRA